VRYIRASAVLAAAALAALGYKGISEPQSNGIQLAYINSNEIIAQAPGAAEAQATFDREMARWRSEVQALADSLQEMISTYEQQQVMLSPDARTERQQDIQQKRIEFQQRTTDLESAAARRQQELVQPIYERISQVLQQVRDDRNYTMIFDAAAGALIAADTTLDITSEVIQRLVDLEGGQQGPAN
jgi:outer membrane protein